MFIKLTSKLAYHSIAAAVIALIGVSAAHARHDHGGCTADETTLQQLKSAKQSTGAFNSIVAAKAANYEDIHLVIPKMGEHLVNFDLVDGVFEADKPEAVVYADLGNGRRQLVAVEYLAPYTPAGPPEGFSGDCDRWTEFPAPDDPETPEVEAVFWTLHAWVWQPNLSGTFAKFNPMVP